MITKTIKLYDTDAYKTEFEASVLSCEKSGEYYEFILDRTLFFPEEGGQSCDVGKLGGVDVISVAIKDGIITHRLSGGLEVSAKVCGTIDFSRRYRNMQNHSGEHIISGLVHSMHGFSNVGFHLGKLDMTMDYDGELSVGDIDKIEDAANQAVYKNIKIIAEYPDSSLLSTLQYRSKLDLAENVRIVTIPGYDICACCAPHVAATGEIGIIKITDHYRYKGGTRVHAICGRDALSDYKLKHRITRHVGALLSSKAEDIFDKTSELKRENERLSADISVMTTRYCKAVAEKVTPCDCGHVVFEEAVGASGMRIIANAVAEKSRWCAVFERAGKNAFNFIIVSQKVSARDVFAKLAACLDAKGGGNDSMVRGSVNCSQKEIKNCTDFISF